MAARSRSSSKGGKMPWLIGGGLLGLLLWPKIAAGLAFLGQLAMVGLFWAGIAAVGVAALAVTWNFLVVPLVEHWLDNRETEKYRQDQRARQQQRPGPGLPRPAFAPPTPPRPADPPSEPTGGTEGEGPQNANGQRPVNGQRRPSPRPTSEARPDWAGSYEGNA